MLRLLGVSLPPPVRLLIGAALLVVGIVTGTRIAMIVGAAFAVYGLFGLFTRGSGGRNGGKAGR